MSSVSNKRVHLGWHKMPAFLAGIFVLAISVLSGCSRTAEPVSITGKTMGTSYNIKIYLDKKQSKEEAYGSVQLKKKIDQVLIDYNQIMSTYISDSEISRFNQTEVGVPISVSFYFYQLLSLSQQISELTQGKYDVTVGPLIDLYGFGKSGKRDKLPSDAQVSEALSRVGYRYLDLATPNSGAAIDNFVIKRRALEVDFSSIAKGHATDLIAKMLHDLGLQNFLVEIGGEIFASGHKAVGAKRQPWIVGVEAPRLVRGEVAEAVAISDVAVATSGDYRNFYDIGGVRLEHTIDPISGKPVINDIVSVTVVAQTGAKADAWATALNTMNLDQALPLAEAQHLAVYFITVAESKNGFSSHQTSYFDTYVKR